jgi:hypothetical protein
MARPEFAHSVGGQLRHIHSLRNGGGAHPSRHRAHSPMPDVAGISDLSAALQLGPVCRMIMLGKLGHNPNTVT